jgi:histidinol-phosphate phosphatase family protein
MNVNTDWTLFLDRDGVINFRLPGKYVSDIDQFSFLENVPEAIAKYSNIFGRIIVVTNQQGIGKGLMTEAQLKVVHHYMKSEIENAGGRIDAIYFCPDLRESNSITRKPAPGMALQAKKDFPEINFEKSIIAGDSLSDMVFGFDLAMKTVFVETNPEESEKVKALEESDEIFRIDKRVAGLWELSQLLADDLTN